MDTSQAVSPAVQPRALWVAAHHVELTGAADAGWVYLVRALSGALACEEDATRAGRCAPLPAFQFAWGFWRSQPALFV